MQRANTYVKYTSKDIFRRRYSVYIPVHFLNQQVDGHRRYSARRYFKKKKSNDQSVYTILTELAVMELIFHLHLSDVKTSKLQLLITLC